MARKEVKKQLFMMVSLGLFGASTLFGAMRLFSASAMQQTQAADPTLVLATALEDQATGYELVLQREPNNQTALEGLASTRLQMHDIKAAITPLQKLVELNPNRADYSALLKQLKQQVGEVP